MGEALMFRAGNGSGANGGDTSNYEFCTQIFESNGTFVMPDGVKDGKVYVRIFGGGAGGSRISVSGAYVYSGGGGGGWMANGWVSLGAGSQVPVTIGLGGKRYYSSSSSSSGTANAGGSSSFGTYLSANGGSAPVKARSGYNGGNGGSGGGGNWNCYGGIGYQFGGGAARGADSAHTASSGPLAIGNTIGKIDETDLINADGIWYGAFVDGSSEGYGHPGYGANGGGYAGGGGGYGKNGYGGYDAGGGGGYGKGGDGSNREGPFGGSVDYNGYRGGGGGPGGNGGNGICLIWYYKKT